MNPDMLRAIEAACKTAVENGTSGMVSWQVLVTIFTPISLIIAGGVKVLWNKYAAAHGALEAAEKKRADTAEGKITKAGENAEERVKAATVDALKWVEIRDELAMKISVEWKGRVEEWKTRYFLEQSALKEEIQKILTAVQATIDKLNETVPAAMSDNTQALLDNDEALAALQVQLTNVEAVLQTVQHNYKSLKPVLSETNRLVKEAND